MADNDKILVKIKGTPSVRVTDDQTIVRDIKVGQPIKRVKQSKFHASSFGGDSLGNALIRESDGQIVFYANLIPDSDLGRDLGSPTHRFGSLYVGNETIYLGNLAISEDSYGNLVLNNTDSSGVVIAGTTRQIATDIDSAVIIDITQPLIDSAVAAVIDNAPEALDTLKELAEALNNDSNAFGSLIASINEKLDSAQVLNIVDSAYITGIVAGSGTIGRADVEITTTAPLQTIDEFLATTYRSAKYIVQLEHDSDNKYHSSEILLIHDNVNAYLTEYAIVQTDSSLGEFDATLDSGLVKLQLTPSYTNTSFKAKRISVDV